MQIIRLLTKPGNSYVYYKNVWNRENNTIGHIKTKQEEATSGKNMRRILENDVTAASRLCIPLKSMYNL